MGGSSASAKPGPPWGGFRTAGWKLRLRVAGLLGTLARWPTRGARMRFFGMGLPLVALLFVPWWIVLVCTLALLLMWAGVRSRVQIVVEPFDDYRQESGLTSPSPAHGADAAVRKAPGTAVLLANHLAEMRQLYGFVDDPDALPGHVGPSEATVQLHDVADVLRSAVTAQSNVTIGGFTFPVGPLMGLLGRFVQAPRLRGALHSEDGRVVVTAELTMQGEPYSWRVERDLPRAGGEAADATEHPSASVDAMTHDLALRVFSDLTLRGQARWPATKHWLEALRALVECQSTHRGDVLRLRRAEYDFTKAANEDEHFYLAYLNLGIVYRRLGLACRRADYHQAARRVLEHAIRMRPDRWEAYHALADVMLLDASEPSDERPPPYETIIGLCDRALSIRPGPDRISQARILDLKGHAQSTSPRGASPDERVNGVGALREASRLALKDLAKAELCQLRPREADRRARIRKQASQSLLQLALTYSRHAAPSTTSGSPLAWYKTRPFRSIRAIADLAVSLSDVDAQAHSQLADIALAWSRLDVAEAELSSAARIAPATARYAARLACVLGSSGRLERALEACTRAERLVDFADDGDEPGLVVAAYRALGDTARAEELEQRSSLSRELADVPEDEEQARAQLTELVERYRLDERHWEEARVRYELGYRYLATGEAGVRADATSAEQELGEALRWFEREQPDDVRILGLHGLIARAIRQQPGRTSDALKYATRSVVIDPLSQWDRATLASVLASGDDLARACEVAEHALLLEPNNAAVHVQLAFLEIGLGEALSRPDDRRRAQRRACERFHEALDLYSDDETEQRRTLHWWLAKSHFLVREVDEVAPHLLSLMSLTGAEPDDHAERSVSLLGKCLLGYVYRRMHNYAGAERELTSAAAEATRLRDEGVPITASLGVPVDDDDWPLWQVEAFVLSELAGCHADRDGDLAAARDCLRGSEAILAQVEELREATEEAKARDTLRAEIDVVRSGIFAERGRLLLAEGHPARAIDPLRRATCLDSSDPVAYLDLARAYAATARAQQGEQRETTLRKGRAACVRTREIAGTDDPDTDAADEVERELAAIAAGGATSFARSADAVDRATVVVPSRDGHAPA